MKIKDIKISKRNPRMMSKESRKALSRSLSEFSDISGITVNSRTGNVVSGNHRWEEILKVFSPNSLKLQPLKGEYHTLEGPNGFTGFVVRVVDWDESKELAANVTANSNLVQGEFTSDLQSILDDIVGDIETELFEELRLDELQIDIDDIDDLDWDDDQADKAKKQNDELQDAKGEDVAPVKEILTSVKVVVPGELKDEVRKDIQEALAKKSYFKEIEII